MLWLALLAALSPSLHELALHWVAHPWSRYSLVFALLLAWCVSREESTAPRRILGSLLVAGGLLVQVLAAAIFQLEIARPAVGVVIAGFLLLRGHASLRCVALAFFAIPIPHALTEAVGGEFAARTQLEATSALLSSLQPPLLVQRGVVVSGGARLTFDSIHAGLPLLLHMFGLAWYSSLRKRRDLRGSIVLAGLFAISCVPLQISAQLTALLLLHGGQTSAASAVLHTASWCVPTLLVILSVERGSRSRSAREGVDD